MTMSFEDCPPYLLTWGKSCGQGVLRKYLATLLTMFNYSFNVWSLDQRSQFNIEYANNVYGWRNQRE
jgi:hypothetical protein